MYSISSILFPKITKKNYCVMLYSNIFCLSYFQIWWRWLKGLYIQNIQISKKGGLKEKRADGTEQILGTGVGGRKEGNNTNINDGKDTGELVNV